MKENETNALHVVTENVALPEVLVRETPAQPEEAEPDAEIDFSGAIPEFHVGSQPKQPEDAPASR
ncbi:MAG: hypothetical protein IKD72_09535 [Clostridia bacterium]|nr:hypothetical protein [Clostridia bacterium]